MGNKKIEVPVFPGESIYYATVKFGVVEYKVSSLIVKSHEIFVEIEGDFDCGEEVMFSSKEIGKNIFLTEYDANAFVRNK